MTDGDAADGPRPDEEPGSLPLATPLPPAPGSAASPPPPGAAALRPPPAGSPTPMAPHRPLGGLGRAAQIAIVVQLLTVVLFALAILSRRALLVDLRDGLNVTFDDLESADDLVASTGLTSLGALILTGAIFIAWFHRAYTNLNNRGGTKHAPGWAIGAWFVPGLNAWRPAKMMQELLDHGQRQGSAPTGRLWTWWWIWVAGIGIDRLLRNAGDDALDSLIAIEAFSVATEVARVVPGVLLIMLIAQVIKLQDESTPI